MFRCSRETTVDNSNEASNPDDDLSINDIKKEIKSLVKKKFELETKIESTEPQKFGDLRRIKEITSIPHNVNFREESQRLHLKKKLHLYKLCGIYAMPEEGETRVCFRSIHSTKEYSIWIKRNGDCTAVTKYFLPPMVPLEELIETYLKNSSNISNFFRKIYHYIIVYENRINQINDFKISEVSSSIDFFSSHSTHIVKLKILLDGEFTRAVNIYLRYPADFIFPQTLKLDCGGLSDIGKKRLMQYCQVYKRMPLLEATREVLSYLKSI